MTRDYYAAAASAIATPWQLAIGNDFAYPATTGPRPPGTSVRNWYATRVARASQQRPELKSTFFGVLQLVVPPQDLARPAVAVRALRHGGPAAAPTRNTRDVTAAARKEPRKWFSSGRWHGRAFEQPPTTHVVGGRTSLREKE